MPRRIRVAIHRSTLLREPPGCTRVVQVNVRDKDLLDRHFIHTRLTDRRAQSLQRRTRPRLDQRILTPAFDQKGSDETRDVLEV